MKKLAVLAVAALGLGILPGCQLLFLPCYVCVACAGGGTGNVAADDETHELQELAPSLQTRALKAAVAH